MVCEDYMEMVYVGGWMRCGFGGCRRRGYCMWCGWCYSVVAVMVWLCSESGFSVRDGWSWIFG